MYKYLVQEEALIDLVCKLDAHDAHIYCVVYR